VKRSALLVHALGAAAITLALGVVVLGTAGVGCGASLDFYEGASPDANAYQWIVIVGWAVLGSWPFLLGGRLMRAAADERRLRIWARVIRSWFFGAGYLGLTSVVPVVALSLAAVGAASPAQPCSTGGLGLLLGIGFLGVALGLVAHVVASQD
jgi:hypothetical protein